MLLRAGAAPTAALGPRPPPTSGGTFGLHCALWSRIAECLRCANSVWTEYMLLPKAAGRDGVTPPQRERREERSSL